MSRLFLTFALFALACSSSDDTPGSSGSGGSTSTDSGADVTTEADSPDVTADVTQEGATDAPSSDAPSSDAPSSDAPSSDAPSSDAPSSDAPSSDAPSSDAPSSDAPSSDAPSSDAPTEAMPDAPADVANDVGPVSSCDELSTIECFANNECETDRRCENAGTEYVPVPCCVVGVRGTGHAGETCDDENDCESGVCIAGSGPYMCSTTCNSSADCPDGMKNCTYIAFSTSYDMWCLPTN